METDISYLKVKLFYVAVVVAFIGHTANMVMSIAGHAFWVDAITSGIVVVAFVLFRLNIIKDNWANGILVYAIFANILISTLLYINQDKFDGLLFLSAMTSLAMLLYAGFTLNKFHLFILGGIYIVFFMFAVSYSESYFTKSNNVLVLLVLVGFLFAVYLIIQLLNRYHSYQKELIEDLKQRNVLLKKQGVELSRLNSTKDKLFSIIGHDLKSPTSSIMGFADLISMKSEECESISIKEFSSHIYMSANMLNSLLDQLLNWARIQTGKVKVNINPVNINSEISDVVDIMSGAVYLKNISIEKPKSNEITVECDKHMMSTVIRNLVSNALKFTPKNGKIKISSQVVDGKYHFSIKDNGVGMEEGTVNSLFKNEPIKSQRGTEFEKGTGLGLVICNEYIDLHKGKMWVESEVGKGSVFYFSLPLQ